MTDEVKIAMALARIDDLEFENAALTKRVAELESQLAREPVAPHVMCEAEFPSWSKPEKGEL